MKSMMFLLVICALQLVDANEFYISTTGVDGDGCGTAETPCSTLNFTLTLANDGDTIYFQQGEYINQPNVTISVDNLSIIGQGNVTFNGIGSFENNTLFNVVGKDLTFENLQFANFFVNSYSSITPLFLIVLTDEGNYNFTDISFSNGENVVIATYITNTSIQHLGQLTVNNVTIIKSKLKSVIYSNLPLQLNQLVIYNCTATGDFVRLSLSPQDVQAVTSITNSAVVQNSSGTFLNYNGPYSAIQNNGGDDVVILSNVTFADSTGSLGYFSGSNVTVTSCSVRNVVISANYQALLVFSYLVSVEVSNSVFDECFHSSKGHLIYVIRNSNSTGTYPNVLVNTLTVSNSVNVDLNDGIVGICDFTYSNINFYNVSNSAIVNIISNATTVENLYFSGCSGGYLRTTLAPEYLTFINITIADSLCDSYCVYFILTQSSYSIPLNNLTFTNVQSGSQYNNLVYISSQSGSALVVNNFAATNVNGFGECFFYSVANLSLSGSFDYNNVTTNGTVTPVFNCGYQNSTYLSVLTLLNLPLAEFFPPYSGCTADYLGFTISGNQSSSAGPFVAPSNLPINIIVACACFSLVAIVSVVCFILYRKITPAYTPING